MVSDVNLHLYTPGPLSSCGSCAGGKPPPTTTTKSSAFARALAAMGEDAGAVTAGPAGGEVRRLREQLVAVMEEEGLS